jgi:hypothetical protein
MSYDEIGQQLNRSAHWVKKALASAERREAQGHPDDLQRFDGSIVALRKFSSSELLDAGFNVKVAADRQGHSPDTLLKHYAKRRDSADVRAAEHLGPPRPSAKNATPQPPKPVHLRGSERGPLPVSCRTTALTFGEQAADLTDPRAAATPDSPHPSTRQGARTEAGETQRGERLPAGSPPAQRNEYLLAEPP